ncbi:MAG: putative NUDIX family phosphoesterase [Pseudohongiellaceae bacterium]|jgi:predicted NUDIX family phosphoesterase
MSKHQEHIICIKSSAVKHRENGFVDYELTLSDLMMGQRVALEKDDDFRQVLPISIFTHRGKVWAYERTSKGGESRLHNKIAVAVGGHWDITDLVVEGGVVTLQASLEKAMDRELEEEVKLTSKITSSLRLQKMICADDTEVDRVHLGMVWVHELDGEGIESVEDQLKTVGFVSPDDLLNGDYNIEVWTRIICNILKTDPN